ncbi:hypothetical protein [Bdellovibrio sp. KM01]|uniref:hypothetical protein n=1 Tax=Bdellovibrio sp. KM01 TaxID=2748865 RepID=UPI0015E91765|nr:hypothetical protein [Bdellovibrio sp. KM01]QLY24611.1 hypothetical protein HW988_14280 [Bdellovibrio sp. KM01]
MRHLFFDFYKRYISRVLFIWLVLLIVGIFFREDPYIRNYVGFFAAGLSFVLGSLFISVEGWIVFWRRTARTINQFWTGIVLIQFGCLALNTVFLYTFLLIHQRDQDSVIHDIFNGGLLDILWGVLLLVSISVVAIHDPKVMATKNLTKSPANIAKSVGYALYFSFLVAVYHFSRLLGYMIAELSLVIILFATNYFALTTLTKAKRKKLICIGSLTVVILAAGSYSLARVYDQLSFLGESDIRITSFSGLDEVKTPSEWVRWMSRVGSLNTDQTIAAMGKLESICPMEPTDSPTVVSCYEKDPSEDYTSVGGKTDETEVRQLLGDRNAYSKLLGLLRARGLEEFSSELKTQIEEIAKGSGRLSSVAEKTLVTHKKDKQVPLVIRIWRK